MMLQVVRALVPRYVPSRLRNGEGKTPKGFDTKRLFSERLDVWKRSLAERVCTRNDALVPKHVPSYLQKSKGILPSRTLASNTLSGTPCPNARQIMIFGQESV